MHQSESIRRSRLFYGWVVAGACFLMIFITLGFCSSTKGLYLAAITGDLGIQRSLFSLNDSCRFVTTAIVNLFFGRLILKFDPRKMILFGFLSLILACLLYSISSSIYLFYLGGCLLGLGFAWTGTTLVGYLVERWFTKSKGTIMGVILAANGLGGAVASQIISPIIYSARQDGWRISYRLTTLILAVTGILVVLLVRNQPADVGQQPLGLDKPSKASRGASWEGISLEEARKKPYFYVGLVCIFFTGLILQSTTNISSAHMKDVGLSPTFIATVVSVHSLCLAAAKAASGFSFDRFGLRATLLLCNICSIVAMLLLAFVSNNAMAMAYGVLSALSLPLETVMLPLIALDLFGQASYSRIMGLFISFNVLGYALGAPLVNYIFDKTGSYQSILLVLAALMLVVTATMQLVISAAHRRQCPV